MAHTHITMCVDTADRLLIRIVKANDWIFSKDRRYDFDKETKDNLWRQIGAQLAKAGFHVADPKARWKQLRDLFVRNDKNRNHKWIYFEEMSFMLGHIRHYAKPQARNTRLFVGPGIGNPHSSLNSGLHLGFQNVGDGASTSKLFLHQTPVLVAATSTHLVGNEVQSPEAAEIATPFNSACGSVGFNIQQYQSETTSNIGELHFIEDEQPISNENGVNFPTSSGFQTTNDIELPSSEQTTNDMELPSSEHTLGTPSQHMSWEQTSPFPQTSASPKTLTVNSIAPPDCAIVEDSTCQFRNLTKSPMRSPLGSSRVRFEGMCSPSGSSRVGFEGMRSPSGSSRVGFEVMRSPSRSLRVGFEEIPHTNTGTKLKRPSTNITPRTDKASQDFLSEFPSAGKKSSPTVATAISSVRATNSASIVVEASRGPIHLAKKKPPKTGDKRPMVVPPSDAFARNKRKVLSRSEAAEDAIIGCSNDLKAMSSEFTDVLRLKKKLIEARLREVPVETDTPERTQIIESGDGFFNLLQKEWITLPEEIQDQLFPEMLNLLKAFGGP